MILGCDAAGLDESGNEVIAYSIVSDAPIGIDEQSTRAAASCRRSSPARSRSGSRYREISSKPAELELGRGSVFANRVADGLPDARRSVGPNPATLARPRCWWRVATACIALGRAMGYRVWATSRSESKRAQALEIGAHEVFESGHDSPTGWTRSWRPLARQRGNTRSNV